MPRDASATRARLLREAERLFASRGVYQATVREITDAAGQRNQSALSYHFGSREDVLRAILARHGDPLDEARGELVTEPLEDMSTAALVDALLLPLAARLSTSDGRDYLRIVVQLTNRFPYWHEDDPLTPPNLRRILNVLQARAAGRSAAVQRDRVVNMIMLLMVSIAHRARMIERGREPELDEPAFLANLRDMIVGALEARTTVLTPG